MTACPNCGFANAEGVKFCAECGTRLLAASEGSRESRRTVTVLFADVTGSTALGEQLDPESLRALMGRYFAELRTIIEAQASSTTFARAPGSYSLSSSSMQCDSKKRAAVPKR